MFPKSNFTVYSLTYASPGFNLFNSEGELAWVRTENCLLAPIKFEKLLNIAPTKFEKLLNIAPTKYVTASCASTHKLKFLTHAL